MQKRVLRAVLLLENSMGTKPKFKKIMDFSIFRGPGTVEISLKNMFFNSKSSKNVLFLLQIAVKSAKTCSTRDFTIRKQYEDQT